MVACLSYATFAASDPRVTIPVKNLVSMFSEVCLADGLNFVAAKQRAVSSGEFWTEENGYLLRHRGYSLDVVIEEKIGINKDHDLCAIRSEYDLYPQSIEQHFTSSISNVAQGEIVKISPKEVTFQLGGAVYYVSLDWNENIKTVVLMAMRERKQGN